MEPVHITVTFKHVKMDIDEAREGNGRDFDRFRWDNVGIPSGLA